MSGGGSAGFRAYRIVGWLAGISAIVIALALPAGGGSTPLQGPQCGDTITTSLVLTQDIVCSGDALYVRGSSNLTLDLNGHSVTGTGTGTGVDIFGATGSLVIKNGAVGGFGAGFGFDEDEGVVVTLDHLFVHDNHTGVYVPPFESVAVTLSNSTVTRNSGNGVSAGSRTGGFDVVDDHITNNGGDGVAAATDSLRLIANSFIAHNGGDGAYVSETVSTIGGNTFLGNGGVGLDIIDDACFYLDYYNVSDNIADQNGHGGMFASGTEFCVAIPGDGNAAQNNPTFQCVLILCAKNRGQAQQEWEAAPLIRHDG